MRTFLIKIRVMQVHENKPGNKKGRGYFKAYRINPYNPLSYIFLILAFIVGVVMFGFVGIWNEMDHKNPFKWN